MKRAILPLAFVALYAIAQVPAQITPAQKTATASSKDVRECKKAVPVMQSPGDDLKKAKREAFDKCMRLRATGAK
jgi:hypothetical protein